jgi:hypothetical protein
MEVVCSANVHTGQGRYGKVSAVDGKWGRVAGVQYAVLEASKTAISTLAGTKSRIKRLKFNYQDTE